MSKVKIFKFGKGNSLVQEAKGMGSGKWNLPIGHLEHGETFAFSRTKICYII